MEKKCSACGEYKSLDDFWKRDKNKRHNQCIDCMKKKNKKKQEEKICVVCSAVFMPTKCTTKTCSPQCSKKMSQPINYKTEIKKCRACGNEIKSGRSDKDFCNEKCSYAWHKTQPNYKKRRETYGKKYREENSDILKQKKSKYQKDNWEKRSEYHAQWRGKSKRHIKEWREKNKDHINTRDRPKKVDYQRRSVTELKDSYLKNILKRDFPSEIINELIETKRMQLKVNRLIKIKKDENTETC
jgi:uncharacterized protein (DUF3820 family)